MFKLPGELQKKYKELKPRIRQRLAEFRSPKSDEDLFYEMCFCICTPQSRASNAYMVELKLRENNFYHNPFDPTPLLRNNSHYIRFHNQKAARLLSSRNQFDDILIILTSDFTTQAKRLWLVENFDGFGMKESSHFLRNIGYRGLAILDRHILKHLVEYDLYNEFPKISSIKKYIEVENDFIELSQMVNIPIDELDLLFWSYETGDILK